MNCLLALVIMGCVPGADPFENILPADGVKVAYDPPRVAYDPPRVAYDPPRVAVDPPYVPGRPNGFIPQRFDDHDEEFPVEPPAIENLLPDEDFDKVVRPNTLPLLEARPGLVNDVPPPVLEDDIDWYADFHGDDSEESAKVKRFFFGGDTTAPVVNPCQVLPKSKLFLRCWFGKSDRYYYDNQAHQCKSFWLWGCAKNENGFSTKQACEDECTSVCVKPPVTKKCTKKESKSWYFDLATVSCKQHLTYGCEGKINQFPTERKCLAACDEYLD